ncbi:hypothetical protein EDD16DRAFT_1899665 [Pisolithus croceorrhizus]|nr:hypothetical protein EDD16DRAFT_1899665 [Pisolithus croceorrhizus]KAI6125744.1 hypothetical protein EV401DRAFT_2207395 [Pisolithus croceorrhizus]KAI6167561.1 hypothetical protein EDD17DRAFT_1870132 [Pisolithus thermaeus]
MVRDTDSSYPSTVQLSPSLVVLPNSTMLIAYAYQKYKEKKKAKEEKKRATAAARASQDPDAQPSQGPQQPRGSSEGKQESEQ